MKPPKHSSASERVLSGLLVSGALGLGFAWGFLSHRDHVFPHGLLHRAALRFGLVRQTPQTPRPVAVAAKATDLSELVALPYVEGTTDARIFERGVLRSDGTRAQPGLNLVFSRHGEAWSAALLDLGGAAVWRWRLPGAGYPWLAEPLANGNLIVLDHDRSIAEIDGAGARRWRTAGRFHHSLQVLPAGIVTLRAARRVVPAIHPNATVEDSEVVVLTRDGAEVRSFSLLDALLGSPLSLLAPTIGDDDLERLRSQTHGSELTLDVIHANHVEYQTARPGGGPFSSAGFLVCLRNQNLILYLHATSHALLWAWGPGRLSHPHHATILANGNILVVSSHNDRSEIVELEPLTQRVVWNYQAAGFATRWGGSAQRLANGNTLLTESATGYAFEVTPGGDIVWEWANPDVVDPTTRRGIYRVSRLSAADLPFLRTRPAQ